MAEEGVEFKGRMSWFSTSGSVSKLGNQAVVQPKTGGPRQSMNDARKNRNGLSTNARYISNSLMSSPSREMATETSRASWVMARAARTVLVL